MNQDEDKKLKKLFQELGQEDMRQSPPFAKTWGAALAQVREKEFSRRPRYILQFATAMILLVVLAAAIVEIFWNEHNQEREKPLAASSKMVNLAIEPPKTTLPPPMNLSKPVKAEKPVNMMRRKSSPRYRTVSVTLSQWHSPTDFLLKSSDEQLLKTIPKLSELPKEIRLDKEK